MNKLIIAALGLTAIFAMIAFVVGMYVLNLNNTQATLLNTYQAKKEANKADLSNLKSKLPEIAAVSNDAMDDLERILTKYANARTPEASGQMMLWVQEQVPNVDMSVKKNLVNAISATRDSWTDRQKELIDISRAYNGNLSVQPSKFILMTMLGYKPIAADVVITEGTAKAFETLRDEPMDFTRRPKQ